MGLLRVSNAVLGILLITTFVAPVAADEASHVESSAAMSQQNYRREAYLNRSFRATGTMFWTTRTPVLPAGSMERDIQLLETPRIVHLKWSLYQSGRERLLVAERADSGGPSFFLEFESPLCRASMVCHSPALGDSIKTRYVAFVIKRASVEDEPSDIKSRSPKHLLLPRVPMAIGESARDETKYLSCDLQMSESGEITTATYHLRDEHEPILRVEQHWAAPSDEYPSRVVVFHRSSIKSSGYPDEELTTESFEWEPVGLDIEQLFETEVSRLIREVPFPPKTAEFFEPRAGDDKRNSVRVPLDKLWEHFRAQRDALTSQGEPK